MRFTFHLREAAQGPELTREGKRSCIGRDHVRWGFRATHAVVRTFGNRGGEHGKGFPLVELCKDSVHANFVKGRELLGKGLERPGDRAIGRRVNDVLLGQMALGHYPVEFTGQEHADRVWSSQDGALRDNGEGGLGFAFVDGRRFRHAGNLSRLFGDKRPIYYYEPFCSLFSQDGRDGYVANYGDAAQPNADKGAFVGRVDGGITGLACIWLFGLPRWVKVK